MHVTHALPCASSPTLLSSGAVLVVWQCAVCGPTLLYALYAVALAIQVKEIAKHANILNWLVTIVVCVAVPVLSLRTVMWPECDSEYWHRHGSSLVG